MEVKKDQEAAKVEVKVEVKPARMFISCRLIVAVMCCFAFLFMNVLRVNLSLSLVCMVKKKPPTPTVPVNPTNTSELFNPTLSPFDEQTTQIIRARRAAGLNDSTDSNFDNSHPRLGVDELLSSSNLETTFLPSSGIQRADRPIQYADSATADVYDGMTTSSSYIDMMLNSTDRAKKSKFKGEFDWDRQFQGYLISSYFYGYICTCILGGYLAGRFGGRHVLATGILISLISTAITPPLARVSGWFVLALRVTMGAGSGVIFPTMQNLLGVWAPSLERSFLITVAYSGITLGNIVGYSVAAEFCTVTVDNGWPLTFYVTAGFALLFWAGWYALVYSSPDTHPRISEEERTFIVAYTGIKKTAANRPTIPWLKIITSPAVIAILVVQTANTWFIHSSLTFPLYMRDVLGFDVKQNGLFLILPHILDLAIMLPLGKLADFLRQRKILSPIAVRKIYQSIACFGSSALMVALSFMDADRKWVAVALMILNVPVASMSRQGYSANTQDIAPRLAGEIFGLTNTAGTVSGIVAPIVVGAITKNGTRQEWQTFFFISAGLFTFGGIIYAIFARGEVQPWAKVKTDVIEMLVMDEKHDGEPSNNNEKGTTIPEIETLLKTESQPTNGKRH